VLLAAALWAGRSVRLETDVTRFLPEGDERRRLALANLVKATGFSRGLVLAVAVPPAATPEAAADAALPVLDSLAADLRDSGLFTEVRTGSPAGVVEDVARLYRSRRLALLSDDPEAEIPRRFSPEGLASAAARLKDALMLPSAALVKRLAPEDPLLAFPDLLQRLQDGLSRLSPRLHGGHWFSADLRHALLMLEVAAPAFDTEAQRGVLATVRERFDARTAAAGGGFDLQMTGLSRFVVDGEDRAKSDIAYASVASTAACALLFLAFFRRLRFLALAFLPVSVGVALGLGAVAAAKGAVHGLTLGFGGVLIGACIDFPIHLLHALRHPDDPDPVRAARDAAALRRNLWAGLVTTLAGFAVLAFSDYPGIREIALFCAAGIAGSFAFTLLFLPPLRRWLLPAPGKAPPPATRLPVHRALAALSRRRAGVLAALGLVAAASLAALPFLRLESDARALDAGDPALVAEDAAVRAHLPAAAFPRFVLASGADAREALRRNDAVAADLAARKAAGTGPDFASVHAMLPSEDLQRRNLAVLAALPDPVPAAREALSAAGFKADRFQPFYDALGDARRGRIEPLRPADLDGTALAGARDGFLFPDGPRTVALTLAGPAVAPGDLDGLAGGDPAVEVLEPRALVSALVTSSQRQTLLLVAGGVLLNVLLVAGLRRQPRLAVATLAPTVLTLLAVTGGLAALGVPVNFLHVVSLLLILCMGIDFSLFLLDEDAGRGAGAGAAPTVLLSASTTAVTFGLMAFCRTSALVQVGLTVGAGILVLGLLTFAVRALAFRGGEDVHA
jgi:predicted exporter